MSEPAWVALGSRGGIVDWEGGWSAGVAYQQGDVVRHNGIDYIAVNPSTGQSPVAATPVIGGRELAYAEFTAPVSATAVTEATAEVVVTAPVVTFDGSPVLIEFFAPYVQPPPGTTLSLTLTLYQDGVSLGQLAFVATPTGTLYVPVRAARKLSPTVGSHTYSVRVWGSTGTKVVGAGVGGQTLYPPGFIRITLVEPAALNITTRVSDPGYGTSLPASPVDGEEYTLVDSVTNPSYQWRFRYNAGSTSAYKWEFVGGAERYLFVGALEGIPTPGSWVDTVTTPGPIIVVPRAGDYNAFAIAQVGVTTAGGIVQVGLAVGATAPGKPTAASVSTASGYGMLSTADRFLGVAAGADIRLRYQAATTGQNVANRSLRIGPVRVA